MFVCTSIVKICTNRRGVKSVSYVMLYFDCISVIVILHCHVIVLYSILIIIQICVNSGRIWDMVCM